MGTLTAKLPHLFSELPGFPFSLTTPYFVGFVGPPPSKSYFLYTKLYAKVNAILPRKYFMKWISYISQKKEENTHILQDIVSVRFLDWICPPPPPFCFCLQRSWPPLDFGVYHFRSMRSFISGYPFSTWVPPPPPGAVRTELGWAARDVLGLQQPYMRLQHVTSCRGDSIQFHVLTTYYFVWLRIHIKVFAMFYVAMYNLLWHHAAAYI